jgi:SMODS-associated NUDIX domain
MFDRAETVILGVLSSLLAAMLIGLGRFRDFFLPYLLCSTIYRNKSLRVSMATILRLEYDGKLLLIKNRQRAESFGPIGGVLKFYPSAKLGDLFEYQSQSKRPYFGDDLRGFMSGRHFHKFMKWFRSKRDREVEAVTRELIEELREIGLANLAAQIQALPLSFVWHVHEGVRHVPSTNYYQFRYLELYELNPPNEISRSITKQLFAAAEQNPHLLVVTRNEILRRRGSNGELIGVHSAYLFSRKRAGPEPAPYYE